MADQISGYDAWKASLSHRQAAEAERVARMPPELALSYLAVQIVDLRRSRLRQAFAAGGAFLGGAAAAFFGHDVRGGL